jgi:uncharacterized protein YlzI (FlbEa/FlbD family)
MLGLQEQSTNSLFNLIVKFVEIGKEDRLFNYYMKIYFENDGDDMTHAILPYIDYSQISYLKKFVNDTHIGLGFVYGSPYILLAHNFDRIEIDTNYEPDYYNKNQLYAIEVIKELLTGLKEFRYEPIKESLLRPMTIYYESNKQIMRTSVYPDSLITLSKGIKEIVKHNLDVIQKRFDYLKNIENLLEEYFKQMVAQK